MTSPPILNGLLAFTVIVSAIGQGPFAAEDTSTEKAGIERTIAEIEGAGGRVITDEKNPENSAISVEFPVRNFLEGPQPVADAVLEHLKGLPQLQTLDLGAPRSRTPGWYTSKACPNSRR